MPNFKLFNQLSCLFPVIAAPYKIRQHLNSVRVITEYRP